MSQSSTIPVPATAIHRLESFALSFKKAKNVLAKRTLALLVAAMCAGIGVVLAYPRISHSLAKTPQSIKNSPVVLAAPVNKGVPQTNSLFATYPSWMQDFTTQTSGQPSARYWNVYHGVAPGNSEAEYYTDSPANLRIENGALTLEATRQAEPQNYKYGSARIDTMNKQTFLYGRIDITAKLPTSVGTWPAAWLLPTTTKYEDLSPESNAARYLNGGELDVIEQVGITPNIEYGIVHTQSDITRAGGVGAYDQVAVHSNSYNLYSLLWTPTSVTFEVNNLPFFTYNKTNGADWKTWPFDQPFYLIVNLAMGGSWGGQDTAHFPTDGIDTAALPATMSIQSIYYYPYIGK